MSEALKQIKSQVIDGSYSVTIPIYAFEKICMDYEQLKAEIEDLKSGSVHSCHSKCQKLECVQRREIERLRAELEKVQQDKASNDSDYLNLSAENNALKSKLEKAKEALNTALNYLHWREDDLIGDDCIGDGKLTAAYKNRVSEIEQALKEIEG